MNQPFLPENESDNSEYERAESDEHNHQWRIPGKAAFLQWDKVFGFAGLDADGWEGELLREDQCLA